MENLNYVLFDEFTKLNKTCITVYQLEEGILDYIALMAGVSSAYWDTVPDWGMDFEQLNRYQSMYHSLSQSMEAFQECLCQEEDVAWVRKFHARIIDRRDPLALLQERGYRAEDDAKQRLEDDRTGEITIQTINPRDRYVNGPMVVWVIVIAMVLTCLTCLLLLTHLK